MPSLRAALIPQMAVHDLAVAASEHRNLEAELADAAAHGIDHGVIFSGITGVEDEAVDGPGSDFKRRR